MVAAGWASRQQSVQEGQWPAEQQVPGKVWLPCICCGLAGTWQADETPEAGRPRGSRQGSSMSQAGRSHGGSHLDVVMWAGRGAWYVCCSRSSQSGSACAAAAQVLHTRWLEHRSGYGRLPSTPCRQLEGSPSHDKDDDASVVISAMATRCGAISA
jgi:hypothetical protein